MTFHPRALIVTALLVGALALASAGPARTVVVPVLAVGALACEVWYMWLGKGRDSR